MSNGCSIENVRQLVPADLPKVILLARSCPEAAQWIPSEFELRLEDVRGWIIGDREIIFGFLAVRTIAAAQEMELLNLAVGPNWRRRGCASALLAVALAECRKKDFQAVFLEVRESNARAIAFYEKNGFTQSGRRPNYYRNPVEAALTMSMRLAN